MKLNIEGLVASALGCLGWPYVSPGTNDERGIDCSGLFVKAFRDQGATIYHGSNTIYRKYCSKVGKIKNVSDLKQGMAVFKHKDKDTEKYPDGLGDFCHIGLVTSVNPLVITHASSVAGCVTQDKKIGQWKYWGMLKDVIYPDGTTIYDPAEMAKEKSSEPAATSGETVAVVTSENGKSVKMRREPSTSCSAYDNLPVGTIVTVVEKGDEWCKINGGKRHGWYMMTKFLSIG